MTDLNTFDDRMTADLLEVRRRVLGTASEFGADAPPALDAAGAIVVELTEDLPAAPEELTDCKHVTVTGSDWTDIRTVQVRNISGSVIEWGDTDNPTRLIARPISNLGYCVEGAITESESVMFVPSGSCCGECTDPATLQTSASGNPAHLAFNPPTLYCCPQSSPVLPIRMEWDESAGKYISVDTSEWTCSDMGSTITFELNPSADTLLVIDSVLGTVAHYNVHIRDGSSQLNCPTRWVLDETLTPMHASDCAICGELLCTTPYNVTESYACISGSEHNGSLPASWVVTHDEAGTGHNNVCNTFQPMPSYHKLNWEETPNLSCGWSSYNSRGAGCEVSGNCLWWTLRWCAAQSGFILEQCAGVGCTGSPTFGLRQVIPDASFDPNVGHSWTYNGTTFTLSPA